MGGVGPNPTRPCSALQVLFSPPSPSGRPADSCLLQHFPWSRHQPGAGPALSARVQGRHPGETLPPGGGGPLGEAGREPYLWSRSQACQRADWRQAGGSDQGGDGRGSAQGSPGPGLKTSLCRVHSSLWVVGPPPLRQGCPLRTFSICASLGDQVFFLETPQVTQPQGPCPPARPLAPSQLRVK